MTEANQFQDILLGKKSSPNPFQELLLCLGGFETRCCMTTNLSQTGRGYRLIKGKPALIFVACSNKVIRSSAPYLVNVNEAGGYGT